MTFPAVDSARFDAAARTGTPVFKLPSVNLLSPKTLQRLAVRRARRRLVAGGLVAVVFVGGGWMVQSARLDSAHQQLTDAQAATAPLNAQLSALTPIATFYSQLDARKTAASQAMAAEVLFSAALADLNNRTPKNMLITNLAVTLTPSVVTAVAPPVSPLTRAGIDASGNDTTPAAAQAAASGTGSAAAAPSGTTTSSTPAGGTTAAASASAGASCAQQDPFDPTAVIGCITLSGNAPSRAVVGAFITNLKASQLYATPFITTTTVTGANGVQQVQFSGTVGLTSAAVSGRYADLSWLADPSVLAAAQAMIAAGDTASNRLAKETAALQALQQAEAAAAAKAQAAAAAAAQLAAQNAAAQQLRDAAAAALAASQAASTSQSSSTTTTTTTKGS